jgi:hypothetical protein
MKYENPLPGHGRGVQRGDLAAVGGKDLVDGDGARDTVLDRHDADSGGA